MYTFSEILKVTILAVILTLVVISLHYECLIGLSKYLEEIKRVGRARIALLIGCLVITNVAEIWIFAAGIVAAEALQLGKIEGVIDNNLLDYVYYSAMTFTTVGYGDLRPMGALRFIAAIESLIGLMIITWSASFTYLEMKKYWDKE